MVATYCEVRLRTWYSWCSLQFIRFEIKGNPPPPSKTKQNNKKQNKNKNKPEKKLLISLKRWLQSALTLSSLSLHAPSPSLLALGRNNIFLVDKYEGIYCFDRRRTVGSFRRGCGWVFNLYVIVWIFPAVFNHSNASITNYEQSRTIE